MEAIRTNLRRLFAERRGATAIEYGLIAALIVMAMMGTLISMGGSAGGLWTDLLTDVQTHM